MKKNDPITNIMTKEPLSVHTGQKMSEVRGLLAENPLHHLPVVSGKTLIGLISTSDMLKLGVVVDGQDSRSWDAILDHQFEIENVMSKELTTLTEEDNVRKAAEMLSEGTFHSLPVVGNDNELIGIVTSTDLIRYLVEQY